MGRSVFTDGAFFGFGFVRRAPVSFFLLAVAHSILLSAFVQAFVPALVRFMEARASGRVELMFAAASDLAAACAPWAILLGVLGLAAQGAMLRALVRDHLGGWIGGLQLGGDEARLLVVNTLVFGVTAVAFALIAVGGPIAAVYAAAGGAFDEALLPAIISACVASGVFVAAILAVRLTPAAAATVGERALVAFPALRVSRPHFWGVAAAYALWAFVAAAALLGLAALLAGGAYAAATLDGLSITLAGLEPHALLGLLDHPYATAALALLSVVLLTLSAAHAGVGAYAFRIGGREAGFASAVSPD